MSETGEYCTRCYSSRGLDHCANCVLQDLGFTQEDVLILRAHAGGTTDDRLDLLADRIEALLARIT